MTGKSFVSREMTIADRQLGTAWLENACRQHTPEVESFPEDFFPETGVTVEYNGIPAAVITIYLELTTNAAILGFCMLNNELPAKIRHGAAEKCIAAAIQYCRQLGKKYIFALFGHKAVNRIADRMGFVTADKKIDEKFFFIK